MVPERAKAASCLQKVHTNSPPIPVAGERRERGRRLRSGRHPFPRLSFFPISTHTDLSKTCFSEARTQKARCTTRPPEPGVGACMYYLYAGVLRFYVSMKHRQCEREPGPDMLSVNATSAVVPFCMLWENKHRSKQKVMCVYQKKLTVCHSSTFRCTF